MQIVLTAASPIQADVVRFNTGALKQAIEDLINVHGADYANGPEYLRRLNKILKTIYSTPDEQLQQLRSLQRKALLDNPLLKTHKILLVKRTVDDMSSFVKLGLPSNHECHSSLNRRGYINEIALLDASQSEIGVKTLFRPKNGGYVGDIDLHWNADKFLFTRSNNENWSIWEMNIDGSGLRQVGDFPKDVDCMDPCYLPDGRIVFGSTASYQSVPCWHGQKWVCNLFLMDSDGSNVRQLCFDQDHDFHPSVLNNGQIVFNRWDYTGINHIFQRELMVMNPDGTGQRAVYGSNSWYPNSLYYPRALPGDPTKLVCIISGYHGVHRMGQLVILDTGKGWYKEDGIVKRISGRGESINPIIRDQLVDSDWPKFLYPYPISDKQFLVSCWENKNSTWKLCLADVYDNVVTIYEKPGAALFEPVLVIKHPIPPCIPDRVKLEQNDAVVYLSNVYRGSGLKGVPKDTIRSLRVFAYHFGYRGLAGPHKIGYGGPWEAMRILGTVPVEKDGSAIFHVPSNTPLSLQALDNEGKAVQLMRSWFTAMPGEYVSCIGCHENPSDAPEPVQSIAARLEPREISPWYGPARGFDFAREVQPVLNHYCVSCHNGKKDSIPDLRSEESIPEYRGLKISSLGVKRLHPKMSEDTQGFIKYSPAYDALLPYVRRVGIEDDVTMLIPGEYHADTSELVQMLQQGHKGVVLDPESWDRIVAWIDLNAPCHGTWGDVYPVPDGVGRRRRELQKQYGGPAADFERIPDLPVPLTGRTALKQNNLPSSQNINVEGWPFDKDEAERRQKKNNPCEFSLELAEGIILSMIFIPAGEFIMGESGDNARKVSIDKPFWMGKYEITNQQYQLFDPHHDSRYYAKRHARSDDQGLSLNDPQQPVVRVSWRQAASFCAWLSKKTGVDFTLPTEEQWEYACSAGTASPLFYGTCDNDFSMWGNMADESFSHGYHRTGLQITGGVEHLDLQGAALSVRQYNDGAIVTTNVGNYKPNPWGLYDMHGNASEWTLTPFATPISSHDSFKAHKTVKGGSFFDRPERSRTILRIGYPAWQRVFNVGFRVVCSENPNSIKVDAML
ncbi:MAG: SUMF1/EgtB/PvdO family nonheme iron enzyme [Candidatus Omnitrophica bacterium]|nr:SUMF1/EgtB/PvdO family nonheme iron enzyme [Candidatus Omnitrophota bacterium]